MPAAAPFTFVWIAADVDADHLEPKLAANLLAWLLNRPVTR